MKLIWDEEKSESNLTKHRLDFNLAEKVFSASKVIDLIDDRRDYGEERHFAFAEVEGVKMCLGYVYRDDTYRAISLRHVRDREWRKLNGYKNLHIETSKKTKR